MLKVCIWRVLVGIEVGKITTVYTNLYVFFNFDAVEVDYHLQDVQVERSIEYSMRIINLRCVNSPNSVGKSH